MFWQATTVAIAAIAVAIPLGIAAGQTVWRAFAVSLRVVPVPLVPGLLIGALAARLQPLVLGTVSHCSCGR